MEEDGITFLDEVEDSITGFKGITTGHASYVSGCDQWLVSPPVDAEGKHQSGIWFDDQRLKVIKHGARAPLDNRFTPGAGEPAPIK